MLDRTKLKTALGRGALVEIAQRANRTQAGVSEWFSGRRDSKVIEDAALLVLAERVQRRKAEAETGNARLEAAMRGEIL